MGATPLLANVLPRGGGSFATFFVLTIVVPTESAQSALKLLTVEGLTSIAQTTSAPHATDLLQPPTGLLLSTHTHCAKQTNYIIIHLINVECG